MLKNDFLKLKFQIFSSDFIMRFLWWDSVECNMKVSSTWQFECKTNICNIKYFFFWNILLYKNKKLHFMRYYCLFSYSTEFKNTKWSFTFSKIIFVNGISVWYKFQKICFWVFPRIFDLKCGIYLLKLEIVN